MKLNISANTPKGGMVFSSNDATPSDIALIFDEINDYVGDGNYNVVVELKWLGSKNTAVIRLDVTEVNSGLS